MWDLSSLTRDQICTPALEGEVLTVWPLGTSLWTYFNKYHHYCWGPGTLHSVRNAFLSLFGLVDSAINQWDFFFFFWVSELPFPVRYDICHDHHGPSLCWTTWLPLCEFWDSILSPEYFIFCLRMEVKPPNKFTNLWWLWCELWLQNWA